MVLKISKKVKNTLGPLGFISKEQIVFLLIGFMEFQKRKEGVFQLGIYLSGRERIEFRQTRDLIIALFSTSAFKRRKKINWKTVR